MSKKEEIKLHELKESEEMWMKIDCPKIPITIDWDNPSYDFRVVDKLKNISIVRNSFELQTKAAMLIILSWSLTKSHEDRNNHCILWAKTQSGKTGVLITIINILKMSGLDQFFNIKKFYFVCGMNQNNLHEQTTKRVIKDVCGISKNEIVCECRDITGCEEHVVKQMSVKKSAYIYVLKNSHLKTIKESTLTSVIFKDCLVLMDEVQYGTNEKENVVSEFITCGGVDYKNNSSLVEKNVYMISISATPYDDIFSDEANCKNIIELETNLGTIGNKDGGYIGLAEFYRNNQIFDTNNTLEEIFVEIDDAYERMLKDNRLGICYIRTTSNKNINHIKNNEHITNRFCCEEINCKNGKIDFDKIRKSFELLITSPNQKPIIFLIKGAYGAGDTLTEGHKEYVNLKNVNIKNYVYLVHDFSDNKAETNIQRMCGRMTGYRETCEYAGITKFYTNKKHVLEHIIHEIDPKIKTNLPKTKTSKTEVDNINNFDISTDKISCELKKKYTIPLTNVEAKGFIEAKKPKNDYISGWIDDNNNSLITKHNGEKLIYDYFGENYVNGENCYDETTKRIWFTQETINSYRHKDKTELNLHDVGKTYIHTVLHDNKDEGYVLIIWQGIITVIRTTKSRTIRQIKNTNISE